MSKKVDYANPAAALGAMMPQGANDYCPTLIAGSIRWIRETGPKMDSRIHATACALLSRSDCHDDCSLVPALIEAMPKSTRRKALVAWFHHYSNVVIRVDDKGAVSAKLKPSAKREAVDHAAAFAKPFYSVEEADVAPAAFDDKRFAAAVKALIAKATGDNAKLSPEAAAALADLKLVQAKLPTLEDAKA